MYAPLLWHQFAISRGMIAMFICVPNLKILSSEYDRTFVLDQAIMHGYMQMYKINAVNAFLDTVHFKKYIEKP